MKRLLLISLVGISVQLMAQPTYVIHNSEKIQDEHLFTNALNMCDFDRYRLKDNRRILNFESGVILELYSVNEMREEGLEFDKNQIILNDVEVIHPATFKLTDAGYIVELLVNTDSQSIKRTKK